MSRDFSHWFEDWDRIVEKRGPQGRGKASTHDESVEPDWTVADSWLVFTALAVMDYMLKHSKYPPEVVVVMRARMRKIAKLFDPRIKEDQDE